MHSTIQSQISNKKNRDKTLYYSQSFEQSFECSNELAIIIVIQMKPDSRKNKPLEAHLTRQVESKLLITTKYVNALPKNNKFDTLRHEEEFNRQYNLKFMTDRKRNRSLNRPASTSKIITHESKREKPSIELQPKRLIFEEQDYRQKYYDLNEYYLEQKKKWVEDAEAMLAYKQNIADSLSKSHPTSTDSLKRLKNDKLAQSIRNVVEERTRWNEGEHILRQTMKILQIGRWEDILHNLRNRIDRFRNLDQCTFKIMELEAFNKRIVVEYDEKIASIAHEIQERARRERDRLKQELETAKNRTSTLEEDLAKEKQQAMKLIIDLQKLIDIENDQSPKWESGRSQVLQIRKLILGLNSKLQQIETEAEENMLRLLNSNKDMLKLERLMNELKDDMNHQIYEAEQRNQKYVLDIEGMAQDIAKLELELELHKAETDRLQNQRERRNGEIEDEHQLLASSLGLNEARPPQIVIRVQESVREIAVLKAERQELRQTVMDKTNQVETVTRQLDQTTQALTDLKQSTKSALFEKQQYKFLLNNLRDQVTEMKRQFLEQKNKVIKQKDEQIIHSNKDILESYTKLNDQHNQLNTQLQTLKASHEQNRADLVFYKKQSDHQQQLIAQREQELAKIKEENERYRKYLGEIETQFKEVADLSEKTNKQKTALEQQQADSNLTIKHLKTKNSELQKSNNQLIQTCNELRMQLSKLTLDVKELQEQRCKLETTVVELRLEVLEKQSEKTKVNEDLKRLSKENKSLKQANEKLIGEINAVTRKLINYKTDWKKTITSKLNQNKEALHRMRQEQLKIEEIVRGQTNTVATFIHTHIGEISSKFLSHIAQTKRDADVEKERAVAIERKRHEQNQVQLCEVAVQCNLDIDKQALKIKLRRILSQLQQLAKQQHKLQNFLTTQKQTSPQQDLMQSFFSFITSQLPAISIIPCLTYDQIEHVQDKSAQKSEQPKEDSREDDKAMILDDLITYRNEQADNVNSILQILLDGDTDIPSLPYWGKIETNFLALKRKLNRKHPSLKLDLSEIDFKEPNLVSPNSLSYFADGEFSRRFNTENDEDKEAKDQRQTGDKFNINQFLRKQNQKLKMQAFEASERLQLLEEKHLQNKILIRELQNKLAVMENASSTKGVAFHYKSLIEHLFNGTVEELEHTSKIIVKMLHLSKEEIDKIDAYFSGRKKRKVGIFATIFK